MIERYEDVIYGRKHGMALTLDVFAPRENRNGLGLVFVVSGGWVSSRELLNDLAARFIEPFVARGYTVFALVIRSRPRFTIPDMIEDVKRGIRFVRHSAKEYSIDAERLGLYGLSAGGHLSLMAALTADDGDESSADEVERISSRVQAVAEFYGPTDFLNYGAVGENAVGRGVLGDLRSAFDFCELDLQTNCYVRITDAARIEEIAREISPIHHLHRNVPPVFIIHGDADARVPLQQSQSFARQAREAGADVELVVVPNGTHGWDDMSGEVNSMINWFDRRLLGKSK
jgi:acetyl esterase/lipase